MHAAECWSLKRACRLEEVFSRGRRASNGILQRVNTLGGNTPCPRYRRGSTTGILALSTAAPPEYNDCIRRCSSRL
jgi:hypothetical protein